MKTLWTEEEARAMMLWGLNKRIYTVIKCDCGFPDCHGWQVIETVNMVQEQMINKLKGIETETTN